MFHSFHSHSYWFLCIKGLTLLNEKSAFALFNWEVSSRKNVFVYLGPLLPDSLTMWITMGASGPVDTINLQEEQRLTVSHVGSQPWSPNKTLDTRWASLISYTLHVQSHIIAGKVMLPRTPQGEGNGTPMFRTFLDSVPCTSTLSWF